MKRRRLIIVLLAVLALLIIGGVAASAAMGSFARPLTPAQAENMLAEMLRGAVADDDAVRNAVLRVEAPALGLSGVWAAGVADARSGAAMTDSTPFLSASIGKLFTAATVLALVEEGVLSLDDDVTLWLEPETYAGLPIEGGDAALREVTIRRLLGHRSGLPDYYEGKTVDGAPNLKELLLLEPGRTWTPLEVLAYTKEHFPPAGIPGEVFTYSDTNYDLLGLIVEAATGQPFHEVVAAKVLRPLGLRETWYHTLTNPPDADLAPYADVWLGNLNTAHTPILTLDWAGGGLATTTADLHLMLRSLLHGQPVDLERFQAEWTENAIASGVDYGYGLWCIRPAGLFFLFRGYPDIYGVSGSSGSFLYWIPEYDAVISGTLNQLDYAQKSVMFPIQVLGILERVEVED
ncbi:MAG: serine hydrolase [Caldilineaceae bacterium]|nr:serine hydrolase [Caldilineaceae bacterium]